ncbi:hypothetical protein DFH29DRAFT_889733 [Suillus ampliporus]|nr:hypothetical protein DFH29DRAFT_889733 [Suillus ampliporus]
MCCSSVCFVRRLVMQILTSFTFSVVFKQKTGFIFLQIFRSPLPSIRPHWLTCICPLTLVVPFLRRAGVSRA